MFRRRKSRNRSINLGLPAKSAAPAEPETPPAKTLKAASAPARVAEVLARSARRAGEPVRTGRTLMVGRDISLTGEITSCEKLIVEGRVDGDVSETRRLEINESGGFTGSAVVEECMVAGHFDGKLTVKGLLAVRPSGRVNGTIRYGEVEIARGGELTGEVERAAVPEAPVADAPEPESAKANPADDSGLQPA